VPVSPIDPDGVSPAELQERMGADRRGEPYLLLRDATGEQRIIALGDERQQLTIGRVCGCDVCLEWDPGISRAHAQLERLGRQDWMLVDDGLSSNGSIVNGERLRQRRRLVNGDVLRFGDTPVVYCTPSRETRETVILGADSRELHLSPAQRRVLVALCRPYRDGDQFATPASNGDRQRARAER
jgi:hypothetical protein